MWSDLTFLQYLLAGAICLGGATMFTWEYLNNGQHPAYRYVGLLLIGLFVQFAGLTYMRVLFLTDVAAQKEALVSWWWIMKDWLLLFVLVMVVLHFHETVFRKKE